MHISLDKFSTTRFYATASIQMHFCQNVFSVSRFLCVMVAVVVALGPGRAYRDTAAAAAASGFSPGDGGTRSRLNFLSLTSASPLRTPR